MSERYVLPEEITSETPFHEVKNWLFERVRDGVSCPCCEQYARVYRRKVTDRTGRMMIAMWHKADLDWVHLPSINGSSDFTGHSGEHSIAQFWNLMERDAEQARRGFWRLTEHGRDFIHRRVLIPKYAEVYDGRLIGLVEDSEMIDIVDVLGTRFDYEDLMRGV